MVDSEINKVLKTLSQRPISYQKIYAQITKSVTAGLLLSQIVYWWYACQEKEFYKTDKDFFEELSMGESEFRNAKMTLKKLELISISVKKIPARTHYKLEVSKIIELITSFEKSSERVQRKTVNKSSGKLETNKDNNTENKKEEGLTSSPPRETFLDNLTEKETNFLFTIFEFWNSYKSSGTWHIHRKLSFDIVKALQESIINYTVEEICGAIDNYAKVLQGDKYFWNHVWPLSTFLVVKTGSYKEAPKKWWQFLSENFVETKYLNEESIVKPIDDPDPELTRKVIKTYAWLINNEKYVPTSTEMIKFVETSKKILEFYKDRGIIKTNWVKYLRKCLEKTYTEKGEILYSGHLCGNHTWSVLMPQYLSELGV